MEVGMCTIVFDWSWSSHSSLLPSTLFFKYFIDKMSHSLQVDIQFIPSRYWHHVAMQVVTFCQNLLPSENHNQNSHCCENLKPHKDEYKNNYDE
jgi:hypothetical protein